MHYEQHLLQQASTHKAGHKQLFSTGREIKTEEV